MGALTLEPELREAAEFVIGNLDEDGYLAASEEELAAAFLQTPEEQLLENQSGNGHLAPKRDEAELARLLRCCGGALSWCSSLTRRAWAPEICASAC